MIRCLITDGTFSQDQIRWMAHLSHWIEAGVELVQIRERDLPARDLAALTRQVLRIPNPQGTKILVNDRADVAMACKAHGVHLRDGSVAPDKFARPGFLVTISCHEIEDAQKAAGASFILLAPIFKPLSKMDHRPVLGTAAIAELTGRSPIPVLALGGIDHDNARACLDSGAAGIAGISYFARLATRAD
jgi:thiamine-phosphate pyrophosphorylase